MSSEPPNTGPSPPVGGTDLAFERCFGLGEARRGFCIGNMTCLDSVVPVLVVRRVRIANHDLTVDNVNDPLKSRLVLDCYGSGFGVDLFAQAINWDHDAFERC